MSFEKCKAAALTWEKRLVVVVVHFVAAVVVGDGNAYIRSIETFIIRGYLCGL